VPSVRRAMWFIDQGQNVYCIGGSVGGAAWEQRLKQCICMSSQQLCTLGQPHATSVCFHRLVFCWRTYWTLLPESRACRCCLGMFFYTGYQLFHMKKILQYQYSHCVQSDKNVSTPRFAKKILTWHTTSAWIQIMYQYIVQANNSFINI